MSFRIKTSGIDLGETQIENIFIHTFMNSASETQLKVYLAGLSLANDLSIKNPNIEIQKMLDISEKEILDAWRFWKGLYIVDFKEPEREDDIDFDLVFLSLRERYIESNYDLKTSSTSKIDKNKVLYDEKMTKFFEEAEFVMDRPLRPDDMIKMVDWLSDYNIKSSMVLRAIKKTYVDSPPDKPSLKYVEGILKRWSKNNIRTEKQAEEYEASFVKNMELYREVNKRLLGKKSIPSDAEIEVIEKWYNKLNDKNDFNKVVDYCSLFYVHSTFNRLNSLFEKIESDFSLSREGIEEYLRSKQDGKKSRQGKKKANVKQNFSQNTYKTMSKEEAIRTMKKNNPALMPRKPKENNKK